MTRNHKRVLLRIKKRLHRRPISVYAHYSLVTGSAGFIQLYKDGERIQPKNFKLEFRAKG